jgi:uncharacterized membrane protein (Fun14 family)
MSSSLLYLFNLYVNIADFLSGMYAVTIFALCIFGIIAIINGICDGDIINEKIKPTFKKWIKITLIVFGILTIPAIFMPQPKTVALMYGVEKIKELNVDANTSTTQLYKDVVTIIHNYATEKEEK